MQFIDFITCGFDQIINMANKMYWRSGMPVPMVIRGPSGGGVKGGPFHSASPEAWFFHTPGIQVVVPSTTYDAKDCSKLPSAITTLYSTWNINCSTVCRSYARSFQLKTMLCLSARQLCAVRARI